MNTYKLGVASMDWDRLLERKPPLRVRDSMRHIVGLIFLIPFWIGIVFIVQTMLDFPNCGILFFLLVFGGLVFFVTKTIFLSYLEALRSTDTFGKNQSQITAKILARRVKPEYDQYGTHYSYQLQLRFTPIETTDGHNVINVQASISKLFYESLENRDLVNIIYAVDDPMIILIEGEYIICLPFRLCLQSKYYPALWLST